MANLVAQELGKDFGLYHVLGLLGDGSMGRLYLAERRGKRPEIVALKSLRKDLVQGAQVVETARLLPGLAHPNIVATSEVGELDGRIFLAMEYLSGENLGAALLNPGGMSTSGTPAPSLPPVLAASLIHQVLEGVRHVQELPPRPDTHAGAMLPALLPDMRPSHLFVTYQGIVKILGCAESVLCGDGLERRAAARGGLAYTAPETLDHGVVDARAAIFSVGVILWECLTGRPLFAGDNPIKTLEAVRTRYIEPPSLFRSESPAGLDEVVLRATSRDPRRRYQDAREMLQALDKVLGSRGPKPESIGGWLQERFGPERAAIKNQIARGVAVEAAIVRLRLLGDGTVPSPSATTGPSYVPTLADSATNQSLAEVASAGATGAPASPEAFRSSSSSSSSSPPYSFPSPSPSPSPSPPPFLTPPPSSSSLRLRLVYAIGGALVAVAIGAFAFSHDGASRSRSQPAAPVAVGALQVQSTPPGAQILIDGDPIGLVTPARINGLRAGRKVEVRVEKAGYRTTTQTANVPLGGPQVLSFALQESSGLVRLEGVPSQATAYIDDARVDVSQPLRLPVGIHRLRIEISGHLLGSMKLDVQTGEHSVQVRALEGNDK